MFILLYAYIDVRKFVCVYVYISLTVLFISVSDISDSPFHSYVNKVCEWVKSNMSSSAVYFIRNLALITVILYYLLVKMSFGKYTSK